MELENLRLQAKEVDLLKRFCRVAVNAFEDGACFIVTDKEKVTDKIAERFDLPGIDVGTANKKDGAADQIFQAGKTTMLKLAREIYGVRICVIGGPVWSDDDRDIVGIWALATPRQHKIVHAFETFAPVLAELLPEGGVIAVTDRQKYVKKQGSKKFDIAQLTVGTPLREGSVQAETLKQTRVVIQETDEKVFGFPLLGAAAPLIDEESGAVVGSFSLAIPRKLVKQLKEVAGTLDQGLTGVSASIQQITAATNDVSGNQSRLHAEIEKVKGQLDDINGVMGFIKDIADETKMLGLNAAIEAARVGDAGRGFGVVAEEIRKLSEESKKTVAQIKELTREIEKSMQETAGASQSTLAVTEETSAAIEEVNASVEEMTGLANQLTEMASSL